MYRLLILALSSVLVAAPASARAELHTIGPEFRPSHGERTSSACTDDDGVTASVRQACEQPDERGGCDGRLDIFVEWHDADGELVSGPHLANDDVDGKLLHPYGCASDGAVMIVMERSIRVIGRNGPRGPWLPLCQDCAGYDASVVGIGNGFFVAWNDGFWITGRFFSRNGTATGPEFQVSDTSFQTYAQLPTAAADADGNLVVAWLAEDWHPQGSALAVRATPVGSDGTTGPELVLNEFPHLSYGRVQSTPAAMAVSSLRGRTRSSRAAGSHAE